MVPIYAPPARDGDALAPLQTLRFRRDHGLVDAPCGEPWCNGLTCPKYWGLAGRNGVVLYDPSEALRQSSSSIFLAEGELDTLLLVQHGFPAVTFTNGVGGLKRHHLALFERAKRVFLCLDQDAAGRARASQLASWFDGRARWVRWEGAKDVTDLITTRGRKAFEKAVQISAGVYDRRAAPHPPRAAPAGAERVGAA